MKMNIDLEIVGGYTVTGEIEGLNVTPNDDMTVNVNFDNAVLNLKLSPKIEEYKGLNVDECKEIMTNALEGIKEENK